MTREFKVGDVVVLGTDRAGAGGVVSQPITEDAVGHVLTLRDGWLVGIPATIEDVVSPQMKTARVSRSLPTASSSSGVTSSNRSFCCTGSSGPLRLGPHLPTSIGAYRSRLHCAISAPRSAGSDRGFLELAHRVPSSESEVRACLAWTASSVINTPRGR